MWQGGGVERSGVDERKGERRKGLKYVDGCDWVCAGGRVEQSGVDEGKGERGKGPK